MDAPDAWEIYYDAFRSLATRADRQRFGRAEALTEAAHEAYRSTADRLSAENGWDDDRVLVVTRGFGQTVKEWIDAGGADWDSLRERLRARWEAWRS